MDTLFPGSEIRTSLPGPFASVALEDSLDKLLDYAIPARIAPVIRVGQRVRVPLGRSNRPAYGYVISIHDTTNYPRIKSLHSIDDERVLLAPPMMQLARWMSRYYCAPLGTVIDSIIPSAVKRKIGLGYLQMVRLVKPREEIQDVLEKTKAVKRPHAARPPPAARGGSIDRDFPARRPDQHHPAHHPQARTARVDFHHARGRSPRFHR